MADTSVVVKDGNSNTLNMKARVGADGLKRFYHASDNEITLADNSVVSMIGTTLGKFSDGFSGPTVNAGPDTLASLASKWNVVRNIGTTSIQKTNGTLVIGSGLDAGNEVLMVGKTVCTIPANLTTTMSVSGKATGLEVRTGYVEVDATGNPIANPNLPSFFSNHCAVLIDGTSTTTVKLETLSGNHTATKVVSVSSQASATSTTEYSIEARAEDITYQQATADSTAVKNANGGRISTMVPSAEAVYAPFIWVRVVSAIAGSATITVQRLISMDIQELQAEVGGGRGNAAASQGIPSYIVNNVTMGNALVSSSGSGAATPHRLIAAGTLNPTLVKSTAGKVVGGLVTNTSTSIKFIKFYNKTTAPTVGTDTVLFTVPILPGDSIPLATIFDQYGLSFSSGIGYGITAAAADNDTTVVVAGDVIVQLIYV